jgi:hypothetical protein
MSILLYCVCQTFNQEPPTDQSVTVTSRQLEVQWKYRYKIKYKTDNKCENTVVDIHINLS